MKLTKQRKIPDFVLARSTLGKEWDNSRHFWVVYILEKMQVIIGKLNVDS
jgi:hypothetical protein